MQLFNITGTITEINEVEHQQMGNGGTRLKQTFKLLQHTDRRNEVPRTFCINDKHINCINGFAEGESVNVIFSMSTVLNKNNYPATFFNVEKIEAADAPPQHFSANLPRIETTEGFNSRNNQPR